MVKRWYIFRDGSALGPYEAKEIREALREGTWDPFDLVCAEGSAVKVPLVEVDDIFASSSVELEPAPYSHAPRGLEDDPSVSNGVPTPFEMDSKIDDIGLAGGRKPDRKQALARNNRSSNKGGTDQPRRRKKRKRDPKRFYLRDASGRILGPQSAGEIQSLFYKGVLAKSVRVLKENSSQAVPVAKFVTVYSERRRKKALQQGAHPSLIGGMTTSQLHQVALAKNVKHAVGKDYRPIITIAAVAIAVFLALITGYLYLNDDRGMSSRRTVKERVIPKPKIKLRGEGKLRRPKSFKVKKIERKKTTQKAAPLRSKPKVTRNKSRASAVGRSQAPRPKYTPRVRPKPVQVSRPKYTPPPRPKYTPPPRPKYTPPPRRAPAIRAPSPKQATAQPSAGPRVGSLVAGQQVAGFGPCKYNVSAVKNCAGACSVSFVGPGGVFTGKFFGDAFKNQLIKKGGVAYISGTVTRNGSQVSIIINGVR